MITLADEITDRKGLPDGWSRFWRGGDWELRLCRTRESARCLG
jgi:hypothetical protein